MTASAQIAVHLRQVYFGGNWTWTNLKETLQDVTWEEALIKVHDFNTIAVLFYHINYFVAAILPVLQGGELNAHDKFSFDHPPIRSQKDWEDLQTKAWENAELLAGLIEQLPEAQLSEVFVEDKYGNHYRNFLGLIEHTHYHLGQISLIKKLVRLQKVEEDQDQNM